MTDLIEVHASAGIQQSHELQYANSKQIQLPNPCSTSPGRIHKSSKNEAARKKGLWNLKIEVAGQIGNTGVQNWLNMVEEKELPFTKGFEDRFEPDRKILKIDFEPL